MPHTKNTTRPTITGSGIFLSVDEFHEHLNKQNTSVQFTKEIKEKGKIPFLDCFVTCKNNTQQTTVSRKPTQTDRLLDNMSFNPTSHKVTTVQTLKRRAQIVCNSHDSLTDETKHLNTVFIKNNYSTDFQQTANNKQSTVYKNAQILRLGTVRFCSKCFEGLRLYSEMLGLHPTKQWGSRLHRKNFRAPGLFPPSHFRALSHRGRH